MEVQTLKIEGMSCGHCVMAVRKELAKVAEVKDVQIGSAVVAVDGSRPTSDDLRSAVERAGYRLVSVS